MIRTTVEALGGAQAVPSELIPARELHQHLINQVTISAGNVVLTDTAGKPAWLRQPQLAPAGRFEVAPG